MTSPTFKNFIDATKKKGRVIPSVERFLLTRPAVTQDRSRRTDVLHPSEMVRDDWCYRASYYMLLGYEPAPEPAHRRGLKTQLIFQEGHAIHALWQKWFNYMGNLFGTWKCPCCEDVFWAQSPTTCPNECPDSQPIYTEVPAVSDELVIQGRADGWLVGLGEDLMLEIKSVGEGTIRFENPQLWSDSGNDFSVAWKAIKEPFTKHVQQVQLYMALLEDAKDMLDREPPKEAVVLYQSKATQEVKEFVIKADRTSIQHLLFAAEMIVDSVKANTPPECNIGGENFCTKCEVYW